MLITAARERRRQARTDSAGPLAQSPLATQVAPAELKLLDRTAMAVDVSAGTRVISQGTLGRQCLVVIDGRLDVERDGHHVAEIGAGQFAGEIGLLSRRPCNADVVVGDRATRVYVLNPREFSMVMDTCPGLRWHVMTTAIQRMAAAS